MQTHTTTVTTNSPLYSNLDHLHRKQRVKPLLEDVEGAAGGTHGKYHHYIEEEKLKN